MSLLAIPKFTKMKLYLLFFVVPITRVIAEEFRLSGLFFGCDRDVTYEYHKALQDFSTRLYKQVALQNNDHFALSQYSIWLALSALAESAEGGIQSNLFKALNLPQDSCLREKYYEIATGLETSAEDITLARKRVLVVDTDLKLNSTWANSVRASGLIDTHITSIKNNTNAFDALKNLISTKLTNLDLTGNSIILDSLDYNGLWTTAFNNSTMESKADFFNDKGEKVGKVDLLKVKKRVKLAHIPFLNAKLLELPVGNNGRYKMLFITNLGKNSIRRTIEHFPSSLIVDIMPLLIESVIPLEVAIPKFNMTSELDLKEALEKIELDCIWKDGNSTRYTASPPAIPTTVYQRVTISITSAGISPPTAPPLPSLTNIATGLAEAVGRGFIANRPFIYGLVDAQTRTWLFSGAFSHPN